MRNQFKSVRLLTPAYASTYILAKSATGPLQLEIEGA